MNDSKLSIGALQKASGVAVDTLRYYERLGLMGRVHRDSGGRRRYGAEHVARLSFIRRAQAMNFSLAAIGELLTMRDDPVSSRDQARGLAEAKVSEIDKRIAMLSELRDELNDLVDRCRHEGPGPCPILTGIGHSETSSGD